MKIDLIAKKIESYLTNVWVQLSLSMWISF